VVVQIKKDAEREAQQYLDDDSDEELGEGTKKKRKAPKKGIHFRSLS
jgi:hypothetical protein